MVTDAPHYLGRNDYLWNQDALVKQHLSCTNKIDPPPSLVYIEVGQASIEYKAEATMKINVLVQQTIEWTLWISYQNGEILSLRLTWMVRANCVLSYYKLTHALCSLNNIRTFLHIVPLPSNRRFYRWYLSPMRWSSRTSIPQEGGYISSIGRKAYSRTYERSKLLW